MIYSSINDVVLVVMLMTPSGHVHIAKPITAHDHLNMQACLYYAHDLRKFHASNPDTEVINIGCPYQPPSPEE